MPFAVRNLEAGPAVFTDLSNGIALEWQAAGDEDGNDIQQVPDVLAENVNFLRAVQKGVFEVEDAPEALQSALDKQTASWRRKREETEKATQATISQEANNDLVSVPCIGPGTRAGVQCGDAVLLREKTKDEKPPLCERHKKFANEYVMTETDKIINGKAIKAWSRAGMGAREVEQV